MTLIHIGGGVLWFLALWGVISIAVDEIWPRGFLYTLGSIALVAMVLMGLVMVTS